MKKAVAEDLKKHHHPCVAHTLNLTVNDAINQNEDLSKLLAKCRSLVTHFKQSSVAAYKLKEKETELNLPELKLKQDVATRWNSTFYMMARMVELKQPLTLALADLERAPENLSGTDWASMVDCLPSLKPFLEMTEFLSGQKYVTMSVIVPLIRGLQHALCNIIPSTDIGRRLRNSLMEMVSRRLGHLESNKIVAKATILDPRFKKTAFGVDENSNNAQKWLVEELAAMITQNPPCESTPETAETIPTRPDGQEQPSLWAHFDMRAATQRIESPSTSAFIMVKQYLESGLIDRRQARPTHLLVRSCKCVPIFI